MFTLSDANNTGLKKSFHYNYNKKKTKLTRNANILMFLVVYIFWIFSLLTSLNKYCALIIFDQYKG